MDLLRPALAALAAWIASGVLAALVMAGWDRSGQVTLSTGRFLWTAVPQLLIGIATAAAAAYAHRTPERDNGRRHLLAVLVPAAVLFVVQALLNLADGTEAWAIAAAIVADAAGAALGWLLVSRVARRRERAEATGQGYF